MVSREFNSVAVENNQDIPPEFNDDQPPLGGDEQQQRREKWAGGSVVVVWVHPHEEPYLHSLMKGEGE